jgi:hypothetical protein
MSGSPIPDLMAHAVKESLQAYRRAIDHVLPSWCISNCAPDPPDCTGGVNGLA